MCQWIVSLTGMNLEGCITEVDLGFVTETQECHAVILYNPPSNETSQNLHGNMQRIVSNKAVCTFMNSDQSRDLSPFLTPNLFIFIFVLFQCFRHLLFMADHDAIFL